MVNPLEDKIFSAVAGKEETPAVRKDALARAGDPAALTPTGPHSWDNFSAGAYGARGGATDGAQLEPPPAKDKERSQLPYGAKGGDGASALPDDMHNIGAYGPPTAPLPDLTSKELHEGEGKGRWGDDPRKRLAIRTFSRGVMGAMFFTVGGSMANKWMRGNLRQQAYDPNMSLMQSLPFTAEGNMGKFMAKIIDTTVGKPFEWAATAVTGSRTAGTQFVRFRPTAFNVEAAVAGRSLGDEAVGITFDFFCASIGDALGRDIVGWFDPAVEKSWYKNGNIDLPAALKEAGKTWFRYLTYNGGEDWAVAIPYAYFMKMQRAAINKISPGFKYDFDRALNGSSFKVNERNQITGNYFLEGALDLQTRFTVYNIGTLMFREVYNYAENKLQGKEARLYGAPDSHTKRGVMGTLADFGKWILRSTVKGTIYMTPAVPTFWITRSLQKRPDALLIKGDSGFLSSVGDRGLTAIRAYDQYQTTRKATRVQDRIPGAQPHKHEIDAFTPVTYAHAETSMAHEQQQHGPRPGNINAAANPTFNKDDFHPLGTGMPKGNYSLIDRTANRIARGNYQLTEWARVPAEWADTHLAGFGNPLKRAIGLEERNQNRGGIIEYQNWSDFTKPFINASMSYTPYMYAKAEGALLWDDGKMDTATERMIEGAAHLNWGEFKAGVSETWNSVLRRPFLDPAREAEAQRRIEIDQSPADVFISGGEMDPHARSLDWRARVVSGEKKEKGINVEKSSDSHTQRVTPKDASHAKEQEMRKALEGLEPPTQSVH